jgi:hypothetical protein
MSTARIAATVGWVTLAAILASEVVAPSLLVGLPPTGATNKAVVEAYFAHDALLPLGLVAMATIIGFLVFITALRDVLVRREAATFWANAGFAFAIVAAVLLLVRTAIQMAIVRGVAGGGDVMPTFLVWDFVYNSAVYAMEASYPLAFAMAMTAWPRTPRWILGLALLVTVLQLVNMTSLVVGLPMAVTLPGTLSFVAWFAATSWLIGRGPFVLGAGSDPAPMAAGYPAIANTPAE